MPGDTFTVPVQVTHKAAGVPTVWCKPLGGTNAVFAIDSATGKDSAKATGGPLLFQAFTALEPDTVADTGAVRVLTLSSGFDPVSRPPCNWGTWSTIATAPPTPIRGTFVAPLTTTTNRC